MTIDLGAEREITEVLLSDSPYVRNQEFDFDAKTPEGWHKIATGTTIGPGLRIPAGSLRTSAVRLHIRKASDTPTLAEFQVSAQGEK